MEGLEFLYTSLRTVYTFIYSSQNALSALFTNEVSQSNSHTFALSPRQGSDLNIH